MKITKVECWACDLPLPQPIDLGRFLVRQRSHLVLRLHGEDGFVADCVTQTRGSPLDQVLLEVIAPRLVGRNALDHLAIRRDLERELTAIEMDGAIGRAWSAVDIALHDLRAQIAGLPLWRMLGGACPEPVPVEIVEGYALTDEPDETFADRLLTRADQGYRKIKIEAGHYTSADELVRRLELFRKRAGDDCLLVLDFAWSWREAKSRLAMLAAVRDLGIDWIEDPFPTDWTDSYRALRSSTPLAVGCGDECSSPRDLFAIIDGNAADLIRIDATTIGGISMLQELGAAAVRRRIRVSYHEHAEVHEHCVFGLSHADHVEIFPTDRPFDQVHRILQQSAFDRVKDGYLAPPTAIGSGQRLIDSEVARYAKRHGAVSC